MYNSRSSYNGNNLDSIFVDNAESIFETSNAQESIFVSEEDQQTEAESIFVTNQTSSIFEDNTSNTSDSIFADNSPCSVVDSIFENTDTSIFVLEEESNDPLQIRFNDLIQDLLDDGLENLAQAVRSLKDIYVYDV